ncbi:hypothetical protein BDV12DRAFT_103645 [Aspergillus spectabilis]
MALFAYSSSFLFLDFIVTLFRCRTRTACLLIFWLGFFSHRYPFHFIPNSLLSVSRNT